MGPPFLVGGSNMANVWYNFEKFSLNSALFGLVICNDPSKKYRCLSVSLFDEGTNGMNDFERLFFP